MGNLSSTLAVTALITLCACDRDTTGPATPRNGSMSAVIDGAAWTAVSIATDSAAPSSIIIQGSDATQRLVIAIPVDQGPGKQTVASDIAEKIDAPEFLIDLAIHLGNCSGVGHVAAGRARAAVNNAVRADASRDPNEQSHHIESNDRSEQQEHHAQPGVPGPDGDLPSDGVGPSARQKKHRRDPDSDEDKEPSKHAVPRRRPLRIANQARPKEVMNGAKQSERNSNERHLETLF